MLLGSTGAAAQIEVDPAIDDLEAVVEGASAGDTIFLLKGVHDVDDTIMVPQGVTIMGDPAAPPRRVVVQGGDNSQRLNIFESTGSNITISGIKFVPDPDALQGGRAVWLALGGENLAFNDNIVSRFTDALFARGQIGGVLDFVNNDVIIRDRDPAANGGFLGGNAGLTVLSAELAELNANGNDLRGPGRNVDRFVAVTGIIVFSTTQTIDDLEISSNSVRSFDYGVFSSGQIGAVPSVISENRLHTNGAGIAVGQVPDPDITVPTPAFSTNVIDNRITGNDFGIIVAANARDTLIEGNQIAGSREQAIIDDATAGETTIGDNLIRGKGAGGRPDIPPGMAFDPLTGPPSAP